MNFPVKCKVISDMKCSDSIVVFLWVSFIYLLGVMPPEMMDQNSGKDKCKELVEQVKNMEKFTNM